MKEILLATTTNNQVSVPTQQLTMPIVVKDKKDLSIDLFQYASPSGSYTIVNSYYFSIIAFIVIDRFFFLTI